MSRSYWFSSPWTNLTNNTRTSNVSFFLYQMALFARFCGHQIAFVSKQIFFHQTAHGEHYRFREIFVVGFATSGSPEATEKTKTYRYSIQKTKSIRTETEYLHTINLKKILATWTVWNVNFSFGTWPKVLWLQSKAKIDNSY